MLCARLETELPKFSATLAARVPANIVEHRIQRYKHIKPCDQVENPFVKLVPNQQIAVVPSFRLESGTTLLNVPLAYKTYGTLSPACNNAIVVCHAFTGNSDVQDWWSQLLSSTGNGALDISRFFVICMNCLGSPYGSASPVTAIDGDVGNGCYGPAFPATTVRDDVKLFKTLLDDLGVRQIAAVVGGSMGGMHVLEFAYFGIDYVRTIVPIATTAQSSAWAISWGEAQRQSIFSDCKYNHGFYDFADPPVSGLGAARMTALLTYRSRDSFEDRFGREKHVPRQVSKSIDLPCGYGMVGTKAEQHLLAHNEGHGATHWIDSCQSHLEMRSRPCVEVGVVVKQEPTQPISIYSAQSYLRYQSDKFVKRFDANCYIAITRKLDSHDVARDRAGSLEAALAMIQQPALVLGIPSDGLFTYREQCTLSDMLPNAQLRTIESLDGHDGFLLEHEQINSFLKDFIGRQLVDV